MLAQHQPDSESFRIAILGCIRQSEPMPALQGYVDIEPDLALWIGDNIYADTENDPDVIREGYQTLASQPAFLDLKKSVPFLVTWDDHDYGNNDENRHYPIKKESKQIFREFWELEEEIPEDRQGIYNSRIIDVEGTAVQFIMLDVRYERDEPSADYSGDILGEDQWTWLLQELEKAADLRFIVSGSQILLNAETGSETWEEYPESKQRLFDLIRKNGLEDIIFIAGDQHYGEVNRQFGALDYDAIELQFSGVNQIEDPEKNIYRVSSAASSRHSVAYLDVYPNGTDFDLPYMQFVIKDFETGQNEVMYRIRLAELKKEIQILGDQKFAGQTTIQIEHRYSNLNARFTIDGSDPTPSSTLYKNDFQIFESTQVRVALFDEEGNQRSEIRNSRFERLSPHKGVTLNSEGLKNGLKFDYVEGEFSEIPDFDTLNIRKSGIAHSFDPTESAGQDDHYAIRYRGFIQVEKTGLYEFSTRSDDGSILYLANELVVDNDGSHSARTRSGPIILEEGFHLFQLNYFEDYAGQSLRVFYQFEDDERQELPFESLFFEP